MDLAEAIHFLKVVDLAGAHNVCAIDENRPVEAETMAFPRGEAIASDFLIGIIYAPMRIEADALISLLDEAPEREHEKIHALLARYDTLMAALVN